jgi:hypothetical protein
VVEKGIDQRAIGGAGGGVDDHAGGLVDDDQVGILPDHGQRNGLGQGFQKGRRGEAKRIDLARRHFRPGVADGDPRAQHVTVGDHPHQPRPRECRRLWHQRGERLIKARRGIVADGQVQHVAQRGVIVGFWVGERGHCGGQGGIHGV